MSIVVRRQELVITVVGLGLLISTMAKTQVAAVQLAFLIMLPSVLLSGFVFPRSSMPPVIHVISTVIPVTHYIEILRAIVLRNANVVDIVPSIVALSICCLVILTTSIVRFRKQVKVR